MDELYREQEELEERIHFERMEAQYEYELEQKKKELLEERGSTHGDFRSNSAFVQSVKEVMRESDTTWEHLPGYMRESLDMIVHKMGRILYGDPRFEDHWKDIVGYSKLVVDTMKKDENTIFIEQTKYKVDDNGVRYDVQ